MRGTAGMSHLGHRWSINANSPKLHAINRYGNSCCGKYPLRSLNDLVCNPDYAPIGRELCRGCEGIAARRAAP